MSNIDISRLRKYRDSEREAKAVLDAAWRDLNECRKDVAHFRTEGSILSTPVPGVIIVPKSVGITKLAESAARGEVPEERDIRTTAPRPVNGDLLVQSRHDLKQAMIAEMSASRVVDAASERWNAAAKTWSRVRDYAAERGITLRK
ncbi:hypothetical protein C8J37_1123 [Rhizobium sp. PP-WC-1G-195]|nr:hypothetical protein C8J37_1123 [Rhizobium sp. PP-WC-1G-195]